MTFKLLDKIEALEYTYKLALNKLNNLKFIGGVSFSKRSERNHYNSMCIELIQYRVLSPIRKSVTETDKIYNESDYVLRTWIDSTFNDVFNFVCIHTNEIYEYTDIQNEFPNDKIGILNYEVDRFSDVLSDEDGFFNIIVYETTNINNLPNHIINEIKIDKNLIKKYIIKDSMNNYIVDSNDKFIFRFCLITLGQDFKDYLITGKKISTSKFDLNCLQFTINSNQIIDSEKFKHINSETFKLPAMIDYDDDDDYGTSEIFTEYFPFSVMYDNFDPQINVLYSDKIHNKRSHQIRTDGIFLAKPSDIGRNAQSQNIGIGFMFNNNGIVHRVMGDYHKILKHKNDLVQQMRYLDDFNTTDSHCVFQNNRNKINWKLFDPNSIINEIFDEPEEYTSYEAEFNHYELVVNSYISFYDQDLQKSNLKISYENLVFKFHQV